MSWRNKIRLVVALTISVAFGCGLWFQRSAYRKAGEQAQALREIVAVLQQDQRAYDDLKVVTSTHPKAWILGTVDSSQKIDTVRARVAERFGEDEARRVVHNIKVVHASSTQEITSP